MSRVTDLKDFSDWNGWDRQTKAWNYHKPFHRINAPFFDKSAGASVDGDGRRSGCRDERDAPFGAQVPKVARAIPQWVPVQPTNNQEREIEGILLRSIHSYTDSPLLQWHHWYDWNFHIDPAPGFRSILGAANKDPRLSNAAKEK